MSDIVDEQRGAVPPADMAPRAPTPAELQAIGEAIAAGDHQGAIAAAVRGYGLTADARWDPALPQEADLDGDTRVLTIGPPAFVNRRTGAPRSAGWLASTIAHEAVHLRQLLAVHPVDGGDNYARPDTAGDAVNEIEAYDWEIRNAGPLGLSADEREELIGRRQEHWREASQDPFYAPKIGADPAAAGYDYWIKPADR